MVEGGEQLVDGAWPEGVSHLGAVDGDPHDSRLGAVIGDIAEVETRYLGPGRWIEQLGDHGS